MPPYTQENDDGIGRRQLLATVLFVALAFTALYIAPASQQQLAATLRGSVLQPFILVQEGLAQNRIRNHEADALRASFDSVVGVLSSQTTLAEENARLRALLDLADRASPDYVAANVIRAGTPGSESMFLLDVGALDGVRVNAPVVGRDGLVGVVREVQPRTAIGVDWTHPEFGVSGMTIDGQSYGLVEARRGDFREDDRLLLNGAPYHVAIEDGTLIVTSGLGGIYPRGIPLGHIHSLAEADAGWRKSYWIDPAIRPGSVTQVLVSVDAGMGTPADSMETGGEGGEDGAGGVVGAEAGIRPRDVVDRADLWPVEVAPDSSRSDPGPAVAPAASGVDGGGSGR